MTATMTSSSSAMPSPCVPAGSATYPRPSRANIVASGSPKRSGDLPRLDKAEYAASASPSNMTRQRREHQQPGPLDAVARPVLQESAAAGDPAHRRRQVAPEEQPERLPERTPCGAFGFAAAQPRLVCGHPGVFAIVVLPDHVGGNREALEILGLQRRSR